MRELRDSNEPVFLVGPYGSGKRAWAAYLCETSDGLQIHDSSNDVSGLVPLSANLYIKEASDLDPEQQAQLVDAMRANNQGSAYRFIIASHTGYDDVEDKRRIDPHLARLWKDAIVVPSLDERIEDIPELLEYYVNWYNDLEKLPYRHFGICCVTITGAEIFLNLSSSSRRFSATANRNRLSFTKSNRHCAW